MWGLLTLTLMFLPMLGQLMAQVVTLRELQRRYSTKEILGSFAKLAVEHSPLMPFV